MMVASNKCTTILYMQKQTLSALIWRRYTTKLLLLLSSFWLLELASHFWFLLKLHVLMVVSHYIFLARIKCNPPVVRHYVFSPDTSISYFIALYIQIEKNTVTYKLNKNYKKKAGTLNVSQNLFSFKHNKMFSSLHQIKRKHNNETVKSG